MFKLTYVIKYMQHNVNVIYALVYTNFSVKHREK